MATRRTFAATLGAILLRSALPASGLAASQLKSRPESFPFLFWHEDTIVVPVTLNGIKTAAIVDSAAAVSMVDRNLASAARIAVTAAGQTLAGPGGRFQASRTGPFQLGLAACVTPLSWAAVIDLSGVSLAMGWPVGFLLGQDVLRTYLLDFDFDTKQFTMAPSGSPIATSGMAELVLGRGARKEPTIELQIEGHPPVSAAVDSGNSSPLLVSAAYAEEVGLSARRSSTGLSATANGLSVNRLITVKSVRMDNLEARDVPAEIYAAWTSNGSPANIGMPLLAGRRLVFDFGHDRLWRSPATAVPLRRDRSGLGIAVKPDRLLVMHVAAGSPAGAAGWKEAEEIIEVDGQPVGRDYNSGDLWRWRFRPAGTLVRLRLSNGQVRHLRLANYY